MVPTEGEPAIVGNWFRLRREASDCFCIELTVCAVTLEEDVVREAIGAVGVDVDGGGLSLATRCAVAGSKADI